MAVYKYHIFFEGDDIDNYQERYVVAHDEEEADEKMEHYRKTKLKQGCCDFRFVYIGVEIDRVIC